MDTATCPKRDRESTPWLSLFQILRARPWEEPSTFYPDSVAAVSWHELLQSALEGTMNHPVDAKANEEGRNANDKRIGVLECGEWGFGIWNGGKGRAKG